MLIEVFLPDRHRRCLVASTLTVRDESIDGRAYEWPLEVAAERLSVAELIGDRLRYEVEHYNAHRPHRYRGLVQPAAFGIAASECRGRRDARPLDWHAHYDVVTEAFASGQLLILIDDVRAESLDEEFDVRAGTTVTFVCLASLVEHSR